MNTAIAGVTDYANIWVVVQTRNSFVLNETRVYRKPFFSEDEARGYMRECMRDEPFGSVELYGDTGRIKASCYEIIWTIERYERVSK